jgi:hypothetical protein
MPPKKRELLLEFEVSPKVWLGLLLLLPKVWLDGDGVEKEGELAGLLVGMWDVNIMVD